MGNQAGIIIRNVKNELFHSAKRLILNEVKGIECLLTLTPLDCPEALDAIDDLRDASLAMMRDIQRSDAKKPKQLMNELFGV